MRLFTAIDISAEVKEKLTALLARLRPLAKLAWSPVDNLHITTKFIGEWPQGRLQEMKDALGAFKVAGAVDVEIRGTGWFPNERRPRVFWVGVHSNQSLRALAGSTEQAMAKLGVAVEDRPYTPHLTLARIKDPVPMDALRAEVAGLESQSFGAFRAPAFYLYLSAGGKYTRLAEFPIPSRS
jgi:RNA 2',3'-cyclic 3'-phosphodiesterase